MTSLITKLVSDIASSSAAKHDQPTEAQPGVYYIRPSAKDTSVLLVHASGQSISAEPSHIIKTSKKQLQYYRVNGGTETLIGEAKIHQWNSSSADITLNGRPIKMEISMNSGHTNVEMPFLGKMKWKLDEMTGSGLILFDEKKHKIAKYGAASSLSGIGGWKKLEILVPVDAAGFEELVFSAVTAKGVNRAADEAASKVLKAFVF